MRLNTYNHWRGPDPDDVEEDPTIEDEYGGRTSGFGCDVDYVINSGRLPQTQLLGDS